MHLDEQTRKGLTVQLDSMLEYLEVLGKKDKAVSLAVANIRDFDDSKRGEADYVLVMATKWLTDRFSHPASKSATYDMFATLRWDIDRGPISKVIHTIPDEDELRAIMHDHYEALGIAEDDEKKDEEDFRIVALIPSSRRSEYYESTHLAAAQFLKEQRSKNLGISADPHEFTS